MLEAIRNVTRNIINRDNEKKEKHNLKVEYIELQQEIQLTNEQIRAAYNNFNYVTDNDSISYYTYLIKALEMKYALLLKKAKQNDLTISS